MVVTASSGKVRPLSRSGASSASRRFGSKLSDTFFIKDQSNRISIELTYLRGKEDRLDLRLVLINLGVDQA